MQSWAGTPSETGRSPALFLQATAERVQEWGLPPSAVQALYLADQAQTQPGLLATLGDPTLRSLTEHLLTWHERLRQPTTDLSALSLLLRQLLYQIYLDFPDFQLPLLLLAEQDSRLAQGDLSPAEMAPIQHVFFPLAGMFGLWKLATSWSLALTNEMLASERDAVQKQIEEEEPHSLSELQALNQKWAALKDRAALKDLPTVKNDPDYKKLRPKMVKAQIYSFLIETLTQRAHEMGFEVEVQPRLYSVEELLWWNLHDPATYANRLHRMRARILCPTSDDCYRMLGIVHHLGHPIAARYSERFDDFIALPQPNGYRALHVGLMLPPTSTMDAFGFKEHTELDLRILTPEMHTFNQEGVLAAYYRPNPPPLPRAWWTEASMQRLLKRLNQGHTYDKVADYLQAKEQGAQDRRNPIFSFQGGIILLPEGQTVLDYAYQVNPEMAQRTSRAEVNFLPARLDQVLKRGDMVQLLFDPPFNGPDFSWLSMMKDNKSRRLVRKQLEQRIKRRMNPLRKQLYEEILKITHAYRSKKGYTLAITDASIDEFLKDTIEAEGFANLEKLYKHYRDDPEKLTGLASRLLTRHFAPLIAGVELKPLKYALEQIEFCNQCLPTPDDSIKGVVEHLHKQNGERLVVHAERCHFKTSKKEIVLLRWLPTDPSGHWVELQIQAADRPRLLADILECIDHQSACQVLAVKALAKPDGTAEINLTISSPHPSALGPIHQRLKGVEGIRYVWEAPAALPGLPQPQAGQPLWWEYRITSQPEARLFFGREKETQTLLEWIQSNDPQTLPYAFLIGQRRVGKSSLIYNLTTQYLYASSTVFPVLIDHHAFSGCSTQQYFRFLLRQIYQEMNLRQIDTYRLKPYLQGEHGLTALEMQEALQLCVSILGGRRLFVALDEFGDLVCSEREGKIEQNFFRQLAYVFAHSPQTCWLVILSAGLFVHRPAHSGLEELLMDDPLQVLLEPLTKDAAERFIVEPLERNGVTFEPLGGPSSRDTHPLVAKILRLTGRIPYQIQWLVKQIALQVQTREKKQVTAEDVEAAVVAVLKNGRTIFNEAIENLDETSLPLLLRLACLSQIQDWVSLSRLLKAGGYTTPESKGKGLALLQTLKRLGLIEERVESQGQWVRILSGLFARFAREYPEWEVYR